MNCINDKENALIWILKNLLKIYTHFMEWMMGKTLLPTPHPTCEDKIHFAAIWPNRHIILQVLLYYMKHFFNQIIRLFVTISIKSKEQYTWTDLNTSKILNDACWPGNVLLLSSSSSPSGPWQEFWSPEVCFWWCVGLLYWCCWVSGSVLDPEGRCMFVAWLFVPDGNSSGNSKSSHFRSLKNLSWCIV